MTYSVAQHDENVCPQCQQVFVADIWIIIDRAGSPDLMEQLKTDQLHTLVCPHCNANIRVNSPLLLFQPHTALPLVFGMARNSSMEMQVRDGQLLVDKLFETMGREWRDIWVEHGTASLPHDFMITMANCPPQMVSLFIPIGDLQKLSDWAEIHRLLNAHPELLGDEVQRIYTMLIDLNRQWGEAGRVRDLESDARLIRRARQVGVDATLREMSPPVPSQIAPLLDQVDLAIDTFNVSQDGSSIEAVCGLRDRILSHESFGKADPVFQAIQLIGAGKSYLQCYRVTRDIAHLNRALQLTQVALANTPASVLDRDTWLGQLSTIFLSRYAMTSNLTDLNEAIDALEQARTLVPPDSFRDAELLNDLGNRLQRRFEHTGDLEDSGRAYGAWSAAVEYTVEGDKELPNRLSALANGSRQLYHRTHNIMYLRKAEDLHKRVVDLTPDDDPKLAGYLNNLANTHYVCFLHDHFVSDIEHALRCWLRAKQLPNVPTDTQISILTNLGNGLCTYSDVKKDPDLLREAVSVLKGAWQLTPNSSPSMPSILLGLANVLQEQATVTADPLLFEQVRQAFEAALQVGREYAPETALIAASRWGLWAAWRGEWDEAAQAFEAGIQVSDFLVRRQVRRDSKEVWLREVQTLPALSAYVHARRGDLRAAVRAVERGRGRLLRESMARNQLWLEQLPAQGYPELYKRYHETAERVDALEMQPGQGLTEDELHTAHATLEQIVSEIQQVPGYETFGVELTFEQIQQTLTQPIANTSPSVGVYWVLSSIGSVALIVHSGSEQVEAVWLEVTPSELARLLSSVSGTTPNEDVQPEQGVSRTEGVATRKFDGEQFVWDFTEKDDATDVYLAAQRDPASMQYALDGLLPKLGEKLIQPVAAALHQLLSPMAHAHPLVTFIPTGRLALVALHALPYAWDGQTCIMLNDFTVVYTPSASALMYSQHKLSRQESVPTRLFAVGNPLPLPKDYASLAYARPEVEAITAFFDGAIEVLVESEATLDAVQPKLAGASHLHLSCHGVFDPYAPLNSGLILSGGDRLTLGALLAIPALDKARLAMLSACQTALVDVSRLPEEVLGLPSGFLEAGVPGVMGSLWIVNDLSTALLMLKFYECYLKHNQSPALALREAQLWLRKVTYSELVELFKLYRSDRSRPHLQQVARERFQMYAPRVPSERPFEHPYFWAAFAFYGV